VFHLNFSSYRSFNCNTNIIKGWFKLASELIRLIRFQVLLKVHHLWGLPLKSWQWSLDEFVLSILSCYWKPSKLCLCLWLFWDSILDKYSYFTELKQRKWNISAAEAQIPISGPNSYLLDDISSFFIFFTKTYLGFGCCQKNPTTERYNFNQGNHELTYCLRCVYFHVSIKRFRD